MIVQVGDNTYGWGADVKALPNDPGAYGAKVIDQGEAEMLFKACEAEGWELFSKVDLEERQVFLVAPKAWRRPISVKLMKGQILQVREMPVAAEDPNAGKGDEQTPPYVEPEPELWDNVEKALEATKIPEGLILDLPQAEGHEGEDAQEVRIYPLCEAGPHPGREMIVSTFRVTPSMLPGEVNARLQSTATMALAAIAAANEAPAPPKEPEGA